MDRRYKHVEDLLGFYFHGLVLVTNAARIDRQHCEEEITELQADENLQAVSAHLVSHIDSDHVYGRGRHTDPTVEGLVIIESRVRRLRNRCHLYRAAGNEWERLRRAIEANLAGVREPWREMLEKRAREGTTMDKLCIDYFCDRKTLHKYLFEAYARIESATLPMIREFIDDQGAILPDVACELSRFLPATNEDAA